jgi:hypothetical protein
VRVVCPGRDEGNCKVWVMTDTCHCDCEYCAVNMHFDCTNAAFWPQGMGIGEPGCKLEQADQCAIDYYLGDVPVEEMIFGSTGEWTYAADGAALADVGWEDGVPVLNPWTET